MPRDPSLTKGLRGRKVSAQSKGPGSAADHFTGFAGVVSRELPDGWQLRRLGELVERPQYGLTASATGEPKGPRFLRITDIQESRVVWDTVPHCECDARMAERLRLWPGDVVLARIGATTGKAYLIRDEVDAVFASYLIRLRVKNELVPDFLEFFTNSEFYWRQIDSVKGGRLKQGINIPLLESLEIPLPPLAEQRTIAEVLRTVQRAKEATEKVIAATHQLKASLMKHLFTYGPVPFDHAETVVLETTDIGDAPERWRGACLGEVVTLQRGKDLPVAERKSGRVPVVGSNGIIGYHDLVIASGPGVTIGRSGSVGVVSFVSEAYWPLNTCLWVKDFHGNDPRFVYYALQRIPFEKYAAGVSVPTLNRNLVHPIRMSIPDLEEQRVIASQLAAVDAKLAAEEKRRAALDALFKSLLQHLMTGKLRL